jgi:hypothetical protein
MMPTAIRIFMEIPFVTVHPGSVGDHRRWFGDWVSIAFPPPPCIRTNTARVAPAEYRRASLFGYNDCGELIGVVAPLVRRRIDYLLLPAFVLGIINAIVLSLPEGLGVPVSPDSPWPPLRALHTWGVEQEPQHLAMPPTLQASLLYDAFVQFPLLVILTIGLWRLKPWPWLPALAMAYSVSAVMNMYFYFMQTFLGPDSPPHLLTYLPLNLPWAIVPMLVAYRFWPRATEAA